MPCPICFDPKCRFDFPAEGHEEPKPDPLPERVVTADPAAQNAFPDRPRAGLRGPILVIDIIPR